LWRFYTAGIGTPMPFTSVGALLGWALLAITLLKKGALQHSFVQIAAASLVYYFVALAGFVIGGFVPTPVPILGTPPNEYASPPC